MFFFNIINVVHNASHVAGWCHQKYETNFILNEWNWNWMNFNSNYICEWFQNTIKCINYLKSLDTRILQDKFCVRKKERKKKKTDLKFFSVS